MKFQLTSTAAAAVMLVPSAAFAQAAEPDGQQPGGLEEIIVTAQKRSERMQDVPITIAAVTADKIQAAGVTGIEDLAVSIPGISLTRQGAATMIYIRGVGTTGGAPGQSNAVAIFIDGVYMPSQSGATYAFNNVERVEVLKGPQGTLYGRNATGGALNITTRDPSYTLGLDAEVSYGTNDTLEGKFYATTGLTDTIAADVAFSYYNQNDGFGENLVTGSDIGERKDIGLRSKLLFEPSDTTRFTLAGDYSRSKGTYGVSYRNYGPESSNVSGLTGWPFGFYDIQSDLDPLFNVKSWGVSGKLQHEFPSMDLVSITAYRSLKSSQDFDIDMTAAPIFNGFLRESTKQFTQEIQLNSNNSDKLKWTAGLFYLEGPSDYLPLTYLDGSLFAGFGALSESYQTSQKTTSYAAYGQATLEILPETNLTLGARYTIDKRKFTASCSFLLLDGVTEVPACAPQDRGSTFKKPTWRIALDHKFSPDIMAFASYSRGFQSGIYNTSPDIIDSPVVEPETLDAFEVGLKTMPASWLRINSSAFYYKYDNMQLVKVVGTAQVILNAGQAEIYGADMDFEAALAGGFTLRGGGELLHGRYTNFVDAPFSTPNGFGNTLTSGDATDNRLNRTPDYSFNIAFDHETPFAGGNLETNMTYAYTGRFFWEPDNRLKQSAYGLLSGQIKWSTDDDSFYARAFARNVLDKEYFAMGSASGFGDIGSVAPGRTIGIGIGTKL